MDGGVSPSLHNWYNTAPKSEPTHSHNKPQDNGGLHGTANNALLDNRAPNFMLNHMTVYTGASTLDNIMESPSKVVCSIRFYNEYCYLQPTSTHVSLTYTGCI